MTTPRLKLVSSRGTAIPRTLPLRRGLVCAGGGVTGAIYEIGVLAALEERLDGFSLTECDVFVGVSAGSYVGTLVASGVSPSVLFQNATHPRTSDLDQLSLFRPNLGEIASRLASAPVTLARSLRDFYENRQDATVTDLVASFAGLLPSGFFLLDGLETWLADWLSQEGRTNDFRNLGRKLRVVAVALDTGDTRVFGEPGSDAVPISRAVAASCALPGFFRPVQIDGVDYIDGGARKTAHISLALKERCGLVLCVNPIVPARYDLSRGLLPDGRDQGALASRGLLSILDQVFRLTLHSRLQYGLKRYQRENPDTDIVLFEPKPEELPRLMRNIMRTSGRIRIAEFAYRSTLRKLDNEYARLTRVFERHGMRLRPAMSIHKAPRRPEAARTGTVAS
ncbi:MAG TPA: patatin-like phospholipase family protein [Thermoanaerobaculia bacterium]|nr:patatin-like phospholipase family protein [Thermoanaerobaculia bacterium]